MLGRMVVLLAEPGAAFWLLLLSPCYVPKNISWFIDAAKKPLGCESCGTLSRQTAAGKSYIE